MTSSTAETPEVLIGECGTLEDEKPVTTPASRKGRRGAMRVTIEPEEPDEETLQKTSTRRRGRKSKQAGDQEEGNKKETSTAGNFKNNAMYSSQAVPQQCLGATGDQLLSLGDKKN